MSRETEILNDMATRNAMLAQQAFDAYVDGGGEAYLMAHIEHLASTRALRAAIARITREQGGEAA